MAIKLYADRIEIGGFVLAEGDNGITFSGEARAADFISNTPDMGTVEGYTIGGSPAVNNVTTTVNRFSLTSDTNAVAIKALTYGEAQNQGVQSEESAYAVAGQNSTLGAGRPNYSHGYVFKMPYAAGSSGGGSWTSLGEINLNNQRLGCALSCSPSHYFLAGGGTPSGPSYNSEINRFPFASEVTGTNTGNLSASRNFGLNSKISSSTSGFAAGGETAGTFYSNIDKFPFATTTNSSNVGALSPVQRGGVNSCSPLAGYILAGNITPGATMNNQKFPFASESYVTSAGSLTSPSKYDMGAVAYKDHVQMVGGYRIPGNRNLMSRFNFTTEVDTEMVGTLTEAKSGSACTAN
jgi:hypothetical protein